MPYINERYRQSLAPQAARADSAGALNFQITALLVQYIGQNGLSYTHINDVLGALEGAKQEFYRRVAVPYEDAKRAENGDIY